MTDPTREPRRPDQSTVERINELIQELGRLLDGSLRAVSRPGATPEAIAFAGLAAPGTLERQLQAAAQRLEQMADLVHSAMQTASKPIGSPSLHKSRPVTLGEALQHAADVLAPFAAAHQVGVTLDIGPAIAVTPAGALYTVILNGLQNAVESVARTGKAGGVTVRVRPEAAPSGIGYGRDTRDWFTLEIIDDGAGLPADAGRCFDLGYTTKPRGAGVGLSVASNVVRGMGGTIELTGREGGAGAILRVRFPSLTSAGNLTLGGAA